MHRSRIIARIGIGALAALIAFGLGFTIWALAALPAMPEALAALESDKQVTVESGEWTSFHSEGAASDRGLILYPGGRVDWRAYAPAARAIAKCDYLVVIQPMPLNLAIFGVDKAADVMAAYPEITSWTIGGHSLGGAMAAQFAHDHPDRIEGLMLWAAYPAEGARLENSSIDVLSISASRDGLATVEKIEAGRGLLPADTQWLVIDGGNHAGFGWYGPQNGDREASISRQAQQNAIVKAACEFMKEKNVND